MVKYIFTIIFSLQFIFIGTFAFSQQTGTTAKIVYAEGDIIVQRGTNLISDILNLSLKESDIIEVKRGGKVELQLGNNSVVKIKDEAKIEISELVVGASLENGSINVLYGKILFNIKKFTEKRSAFTVTSPSATASVRGTIFAFDATTEQSTISVLEGDLTVYSPDFPDETYLVTAGRKISAKSGEPPTPPIAMTQEEMNSLKQWSEEQYTLPIEKPKEDKGKTDTKAPDKKDSSKPPDTKKTPDTDTKKDKGKDDKGDKDSPKPGFQMGGGVGSETIDGKNWTRISLRPEFSIGKIGVKLDGFILIDKDGNIRKDDWDSAKDILNLIYYIRYGERKDKLYFKVGNLDDYTLANGLIMDRYSNTVEYPAVRKTGVEFSIGRDLGGIETFFPNVKNFAVIGARVYARPLNKMKLGPLSKLEFGHTQVVDRNQFSDVPDKDGDKFADMLDAFPDDKAFWKDTDGDGHPDPGAGQIGDPNKVDIDADNDNIPDWESMIIRYPNIPIAYRAFFDTTLTLKPDPPKIPDDPVPANAFGFDATLPIFHNKLIGFDIYSEWAKITGTGSGKGMGFVLPGARFSLGPATLRIERRDFKEKFIRGYFDSFYEINKVQLQTVPPGDTTMVFITKLETLKSIPALQGIFGELTLKLFDFAQLTANYEDLKSNTSVDTSLRSLYASAKINGKYVPKLSSLSASYEQKYVNKLFDLKTETTILQVKGGYEIGPNTELAITYRETYKDKDGSGKIDKPDETIKTTLFGVDFKF